MGPTSVHERIPPRHSSWSASPPPPLIILRTTTTTVPWRTHDNDGVDGALIQSNEVDHVVRRIVQDRLEHQQPLGHSHRYQQSHRQARRQEKDLQRFTTCRRPKSQRSLTRLSLQMGSTHWHRMKARKKHWIKPQPTLEMFWTGCTLCENHQRQRQRADPSGPRPLV